MNPIQPEGKRTLTRRQMLAQCGLAAAGLSLAGCSIFSPHSTATKTRKVLFFSKSSIFEHPVIKRHGNEPSLVEKILADLGPKHGIEFSFSKDGSLFSAEYVKQFDAFLFFNCDNPMQVGLDGFPAMTLDGRNALLEAIKNGKGFVGTHSAIDTFHSNPTEDLKTKEHVSRYQTYGAQSDDYVKMLGGEFIVHGAQQKAKMRVTDMKFPGLKNAGAGFELTDEWYSLKEFSDDLHVLLVIETDGMKGPPYQRPPYPSTWARMHGKGRVFYTAMGHREDVWTNPLFQEILFGGIAWAVRNVDADVTPNLKRVTPNCSDLPPKPRKATPV